MAKGRLVSCHNKWVHFDGTVPHQTMPFTGSRITIVYFTRRGWIRVDPPVKDYMHKIGFNVPTADYLGEGRDEADDIMEGATVVPKSQVVVPEDDELDEDETVDIVMRENLDSAAWKGRTWAELFRNFVGADWDEECVDQERPLGIRFFGGGGGAPYFAL